MTIDKNKYDVVVVGAGIAGSAAARKLAEADQRVLVIDRRPHVAGNMYDYRDENGFLLHKYGPHTFHTESDDLMTFMSRFESWVPYKLKCGTYMNGKHIEMPFNFSSIDQLFDEDDAVNLKSKLITTYQRDTNIIDMLKSPDLVIRTYAEYLFEHDFKLYTAKQWGISPVEVDPTVLKRVPIRISYDDHYLGDKYEVMPKFSFTHCIENMLYHPNISVKLNDVFSYESAVYCKDNNIKVVFTGPLDELLGYRFGRLPYRSLEFTQQYSLHDIQPYAVEAYPEDPIYTRAVDYSKLTGPGHCCGTTVIWEQACQSDDEHEPYYPIQSDYSTKLYQTYYKTVFEEFPNIAICGRLALFKYMNMDQTLKTALECASSLLSPSSRR